MLRFVLAAWLAAALLPWSADAAAASASPAAVGQRTQRWRVASFAQDAGLARQNIFDFAFEKSGTVWVAASGGLYRYDGYVWRRYGEEDGLPSHFVRSVLVDHGGTLWVGTDRGAGTFDGRKFDPQGSGRGLAGPSVRRIVEDPDGTLWFCSDHWPDATAPAGLTSYSRGRWKAYTTRDGLPANHLYGYFRDSAGRQFALTESGVAQRHGDRWGPPDGGEALGSAVCWTMAEIPGAGVFARASDAMYILKDGRWTRLPVPASHHVGTCPLLCSTRDGDIVTCDFDGSHFGFFRWNGHDLEPFSPAVEEHDHSVEYLAEAPDGALWYSAYGSLVRWTRFGGEWTQYRDLPFPRVVDRQKRVWFADPRATYTLEAGRFVARPEMAGALGLDAHGDVWAWRPEGRITLDAGPLRQFGPEDTGLERVTGFLQDHHGRSWFYGSDAKGRAAAAFFDDGSWHRVPIPQLGDRSVEDADADPTSGIWCMASDQGRRDVTCVRIDGAAEPEVRVAAYGGVVYGPPHLAADPTGNLWLSGQAGLYRLARAGTGAWQRMAAIPGNDVGKGVTRGEQIWFPYNGWTGGESGFAEFQPDRGWRHFSADFADLMTVAPDGMLYVGIDKGLDLLAPGWAVEPSQLTVPDDQRVHTLVRDGAGDLWMGVVQPDGSAPTVLRYHANPFPPRTEIDLFPSEVRRDRMLPLQVSGRDRLVPESEARTFRFSWRFDEGAWTPYQMLPTIGLPVAGLSAGTHRFQIRAEDEALKADPVGAERTFRVLPIPLQERSWFKPAVLAIFAAMAALAIVAIERARRLARANAALDEAREGLEARVAERTAELSTVHARLLEASRRAGMAEVATSVLHNVGNVLNSVNVSATLAMEQVEGSAVAGLPRLNALIQEHASDFGRFVAEDPRGRLVPEYLAKLASASAAERQQVLAELQQLRTHVDHINEIVTMQQSYARVSGVVETVPLPDIVEDALRMNAAALDRHGLAVERDYRAKPAITVERHKVLQILVNLIRNAKYACDESGRGNKAVIVRTEQAGDRARISIIDNGVGIPPENLTRIFSHGFTTRPAGHGFGLHSGALAARELGGSLVVQSEGVGKGATFTLELPLVPPALSAAGNTS